MDRDTEIEVLREALRRRVEQTSVRQAAAEVKMSHGGVYNFISGSVAPYGKTLAKLRAWYVEQSARAGGGVTVETARFIVDQLLGTIPRYLRPEAGVALLDSVESVYGRFGVPVPPWLNELRKELKGN